MLYRPGDIKWTKGAYLRRTPYLTIETAHGRKERHYKRKKYVIAQLPGGQVTFARSYDDRLTPSPIVKIQSSVDRGGRNTYSMEALLSNQTRRGKKLLQDRSWEIVAVNPRDINPALRPKRRPFDALPADEVEECVKTVVGIADGTLSRHILMEKNTDLGARNIGKIEIAGERYFFSSKYYRNDWLHHNTSYLYDDHLLPPNIKQAIFEMDITFSISRPAALKHHAEIAVLLTHLPTVLFKLQKLADLRGGDVAIRLKDIVVKAETEMPRLKYNRIKNIFIGRANEAQFRRRLTPVRTLDELVNPLRG